MPPSTIAAAVDHVAGADPVMAGLIEIYPQPVLARRRGKSRFEQLAEWIAYQQLAGKAAEAIWGRVRAQVAKSQRSGDFTPPAVLDAGYDALRAAGLSNAKALSLLDLAGKVDDGTVRLDRIGRLADDAVISELIVVRGIGRWTAEMFLIFTLGRLDVWPVGDYGVRAGYGKAYDRDLPTARELAELGKPFRPYRTVAAWYCWRAAGA